MSGATVWDAVLGSGLTLRQTRSLGWSPGSNVVEGRESAGLDPSELYGGRAAQVARITSADMDGVLGIDEATGLSVTDGVTIALRKADTQGGYLSGSNHPALACTNALVLIDSISVRDEGDASADLSVHFRSTDGSDPVTPSTGNALTAAAYQGQFGLGTVKFTVDTATEITPDVVGFTVNPGITLRKFYTNGLNFPTRINVRQRLPFIDVFFRSVDDLENLATYNNLVNATCYLRKRADGDQFVADITTSHIKYTFATGLTEFQTLDAADIEDAEVTVRLYGKALTATGSTAIT